MDSKNTQPIPSKIEGVKVIPLKKICDERGMILHMLRKDDPHFIEFGEIYFSTAYPGAIKGWHVHKSMTLNYACPVGMVKFVLYDARKESKTFGALQEIFLGQDNYCLVQVPPGVINGYKGYGTEMAFVANCATEPHSADEISRIDPFTKEIPYDWALVHR